MVINQIKLVYFSPTGTTRKVLESIAKGIAVEDVEHIDLTLPSGTQRKIPPFSDEVVIIGAPVYGGRLPADAISRFKQQKASNTLAVVIVVYGNREFEDALLELKNLSVGLGFCPIAGGAFIGEHSFATEDVPIANGRPDSLDVQKAIEFGAEIKEKITALQSADAEMDLEIPGRFPYESKMHSMVVSPVTKEEICTVCGTCASVCPTEAISINSNVTTKVELCIRCCACIKACPTGARIWENSKMKEIAAWLNENCKTRKEPRIFGIDV
ncbi:MAG: 4Fe-4S binding protein [Deltaproteobacteria bacterium]|nr:4Fe-4S binding protein [Deltaproteobacteria bacterium]